MKIAIVGSGVSGLSALWALSRYSEHEVHIYDKADWAGGHAHTVSYQRPGKERCDVDCGFMLLNPHTYPNFLRFLQHQGVDVIRSSNSLSVTHHGEKHEWASEGLKGLFCQPRNIFKKRMYRVMLDVWRFNNLAPEVLGNGFESAVTVGEYLEQEGFSKEFKHDYLLPITASIWSTPTDKVFEEFPIVALVRFMHNHLLLHPSRDADWMSVRGGSSKYVNSILWDIPPDRVHLQTKVIAVGPAKNGAQVILRTAEKEIGFDHVIMAAHTDESLAMLAAGGEMTEDEERILSACEWIPNEVVVHWDDRFLPQTNTAQKMAWNYLTVPLTEKDGEEHDSRAGSSDEQKVSITFNLNRLQGVPVKSCGRVIMTMNPPFEVDPAKVLSRWHFHHPAMTQRLLDAQKELPKIQGKRGLTFVGGWTGNGFHEDAFKSGLIAARDLGATLPWPIEKSELEAQVKSGTRKSVSQRIARWIGRRRTSSPGVNARVARPEIVEKKAIAL